MQSCFGEIYSARQNDVYFQFLHECLYLPEITPYIILSYLKKAIMQQ